MDEHANFYDDTRMKFVLFDAKFQQIFILQLFSDSEYYGPVLK